MHVDRRRERVVHEEGGDVVVLATTEEHAVGEVDRAPGPADLLVIGDRRAGSLVVDDEAEVGLVEAHPERDRRDEGLHLARDQRVLQRLALLGREVRVVRPGVDPLRPQERGDALRVGDGQAIDDAAARQLRQATRQPGQALGLVRERDRVEPERVARERPAEDLDTVPELGDDVGHDPVVGRGRRRQDRDARVERAQDRLDPAVVGPEVVAPVGDAVRLVDDEEADRVLDARQHVRGESLVGEAFRGDEQDVDRVGREPVADRLPLVRVARVDRRGPEAEALGHRDLVAHQRQQRADDQGRATAFVAAHARRDPVDEALAPAGPLHDQGAPAVPGDGLDRLALAVAERRRGAEHRREVTVQGIHRSQCDRCNAVRRPLR